MLIGIRSLVCIILGLLVLTSPSLSYAWQEDPLTEPVTEVEPPEEGDPLGRQTPKSSFIGFLTAAEAFEWEIASNYLDLRNLPQSVRAIDGSTLAEQFYFVLQRRAVEVNGDILSNRTEGQAIDELPDYRDELARINTMDGEVTLLLQKVPGPEDSMIWKVSNATVSKIPELYDEFSYPEWVEKVRNHFPANKSFIGIELFKWIILLGFALILIPMGWLIAIVITRLFCKKESGLYQPLRRILAGPILALIVAVSLSQLLRELGVSATADKVMEAKTLTTVFLVWLIWAVTDFWRARRRIAYEKQGRTDAGVLGRPLANTIKLISILLGLLFWLANAGIDITALLAGLGIGGVALALALQKPIEDLFGALSIYSQQPVATGDLCKYQNQLGMVEEIGLRSTRFRTLSNTVVHVPNSQLAYGVIENITSRKKIMYHPDIPLRYDTSRAQLEEIIANTRNMLQDLELVENETIRVRVHSLTEQAINLRIRIFASTTSFDEYLETVEEINLGLISIVENAGAHFSQRATSVLLEQPGK